MTPRLLSPRFFAGTVLFGCAAFLLFQEARYQESQHQADQARATLYATRISLAQQKLQKHDFRRVRELLTQTRSHAERGLEWDYLNAGCPQEHLPLVGHRGEIVAVAFSPGGTRLATAARDHTLRLWQISDGSSIVYRSRCDILTVAFSPDGNTLALGDEWGQISLLNGASLSLKRSFRIEPAKGQTTAGIRSLAYSSDGKLLAVGVGARGWGLSLCDAETGRVLRVLPETPGVVTSLAFSPQGALLAVGGDRGVQVYHTESGVTALSDLPGDSIFTAVAFSPDGKWLATADWEGYVSLRSTRNLSAPNAPPPQITRPDGDIRFSSTTFDATSGVLMTGGDDGNVYTWDVGTLKPAGILPGHTGRVTALSLSRSNDTIATVSGDRTVVVWRPRRESPIVSYSSVGQSGRLTALRLSPDGKQVVTLSDNGSAMVRDTATGQKIAVLPERAGDTYPVAFLPDGKHLLLPNADGIGLFATTSQPVMDKPALLSGADIYGLAVTPDGKRLYAATLSDSVVTSEIKTDRTDGAREPATAVLPAHNGPVHTLALSKSGRYLITATTGSAPSLFLWRVQERELEDRYTPSAGIITALAVSPDDRFFAAGHDNGVVTLWSLLERGEKRLLYTLSTDGGRVNSLSINSEGTRLAVAYADGHLALYDTTTGEPLLTLSPSELGGPISSVAFLPGKAGLLLGGQDGQLRRLGGMAIDQSNSRLSI